MTTEVCQLPNGSTLFVEDDEVGGRRYWSDEVGVGVMVWSTSLVDISTLLAAMVEEARIVREEQQGMDAKRRIRFNRL